MDVIKKKFINDFLLKNNEDTKSFHLVLEKLNEIFSSILNDISLKLNGKVNFKINLIGEHFLNSFYNFNNPINILIEYITEDEDLLYSQKRAKKGTIGKIYSDTFNKKNNLIMTIDELSKVFYNELSIRTKNTIIYLRKNQIAIKFLDYKFIVFFVNNNALDCDYEFILKNKEFNLNLTITNENLIQKNIETKGNFFNLIKFYKIIELELMLMKRLKINASKIPYFYENLLFNIPNDLLNNDLIYNNFLASFSYLINADIKEFNSADNRALINDSFKMHIKPYITSYDVNKVLKQTKIFISNIDSILSDKQN